MFSAATIVFYNTSKAALNMAMRSNSKALKKRGITVALISPGAVDTDMMNMALDRRRHERPVETADAGSKAQRP